MLATAHWSTGKSAYLFPLRQHPRHHNLRPQKAGFDSSCIHTWYKVPQRDNREESAELYNYVTCDLSWHRSRMRFRFDDNMVAKYYSVDSDLTILPLNTCFLPCCHNLSSYTLLCLPFNTFMRWIKLAPFPGLGEL
jgi:hypothetical protein